MKEYNFSLKVYIFIIFLFYFFLGNIYSEDDVFIKKTLSMYIESGSYYDLVIWADKLGIEITIH